MKTIITAIAATLIATASIADEATVYLAGVTDANEFAGRVAAITEANDVLTPEQELAAYAATIPFSVFTLEISQGEATVERNGPLMEFGQCDHMAKTAAEDVARAYATTHPDGWADENGVVWQLADWNFDCVRVEPAQS